MNKRVFDKVSINNSSHVYTKTRKVKFNNNIFQVFLRDDNKICFLKIDKDSYIYPSALEFLHLNSLFSKKGNIYF